MSDGSSLALKVSRFDERQRRLQLRLPKSATGWDYASLIDVVRRGECLVSEDTAHRTASEWIGGLNWDTPCNP